MADYLIKGESLAAIADEVRTLAGSTDTMSPDALKSNLNDANNEVDSQANLIEQIAAALEGKASGGAGGSVEACVVDIYIGRPTVTPRAVSVSFTDCNMNSSYIERLPSNDDATAYTSTFTVAKGTTLNIFDIGFQGIQLGYTENAAELVNTGIACSLAIKGDCSITG